MTPTQSKYMTMAVPRYTSYPTVPHFSAEVTGPVYEDWLARLDPAEPISLYLHVPFCKQLCWYCGCNMKLATRDAPLVRYADTLLREIDLLADRLPARMAVSHLHWGGGTPTALAPDDIARAMDRIRARFDLGPDAEIAIESDPRTLTDAMTARIGALGFTRASFGVQEFDPKVQAAINRIQPPEMVARAVDGLRAAGVRGINFDLIYGLPHQTVETLVATIEACRPMQPDRLALFGYAHVPWVAKRQRLLPADALPGPDERLRQAARGAEALVAQGYVPIGLDHFALPSDDLARAAAQGMLRRNFQGYTTDRARSLLGLGASSIGRTPEGFVQNLSETGAWARAVEAGQLPVAKGHALIGEDAVRGRIIEELMCAGSVRLPPAEPVDGFDAEREILAAYARDGIISIENNVLRMRDGAQSLVRVVAAVFDSYLTRGSPGHSSAV